MNIQGYRNKYVVFTVKNRKCKSDFSRVQCGMYMRDSSPVIHVNRFPLLD